MVKPPFLGIAPERRETPGAERHPTNVGARGKDNTKDEKRKG